MRYQITTTARTRTSILEKRTRSRGKRLRRGVKVKRRKAMIRMERGIVMKARRNSAGEQY
jgi:hypothetical protein